MGNVRKVHRLPNFTTARGEFLFRVGGMTGTSREFLVLAGRVVANETVHILRLGEVKVFVLPPVPGVAAGTTGPVGGERNTEVIDDMLFA